MSKVYAVKKGRETGVFDTWEDCEKQVKGFKGCEYRSFQSKEEALNYLNGKPSLTHGLIAYVDGSFNVKKQIYGYGCVLIEGQQIKAKFYGKGDNPEHVSMRNVAGEIQGSIKAISYALENGYDHIAIYYDYEGIEKWATHAWKANKTGTQSYVAYVDKAKKKLQISFIKVLAHSGDTFNEEADQLAKKAVGL